ncbi:hypothetical protein ACIBTZ_16490 [Micromonospora sp. NPDC049460]|uniref:hypothetical protein n=1 Tax=Micromonospora sp. NPDC049460 TaxID=3364272 RepID=UPI0037884E60
MLFVVLGEAVFDVGEAGSDAVLVALQGGEVDGVGEVRSQQLVALGFQACPVRCEVGDLLIPARRALVERGIDFGDEVSVVGFADRDRCVGVLDEPLCDRDGYGTAGAGGLLRGAARADEVGVGGTARVGGEVQQHPRPTRPAVQQPGSSSERRVTAPIVWAWTMGTRSVRGRMDQAQHCGADVWWI